LQLNISGKTIFYTGDVNFEDHAICKGADFPGETVDTLIIETTRGDTERRAGYTREGEASRLADAIDRCLTRGGTVMIPVFAMGKTQEMLMTLHELQALGEIPVVPVQMGGLSTKMTHLYDYFSEKSRRKHAGFRFMSDMPMLQPARRRRGSENNGDLPFIPGRIYTLSSGMMTENTVSNRFARHIVSDPKNALLFVGYADPDTPAGRILAAGPGDVVDLNSNGGRRTPLRCEVEKFDFSGHAPRSHLADFVVRTGPRHVILVHGDEPAREWMAAEIRTALPETRVTIPQPGEQVEI
jgi:predicted metal-dependent RNase